MYFGFDIGGTKIEFGAFNENLERNATVRIPTPTDNYDQLVENIASIVKQHDLRLQTKGLVGIGFPGIKSVNGTVIAANIPCVNGKNLARDLSEQLNRPVKLENDANCFTLSEAWDDELKQFNSVLGLIVGTGLGGGLVYDGKVFSGLNGMAGELGHMRLPVDAWLYLGENPPLYECGCGKKGCLETYLSGTGFEKLYHNKCGIKKSAPAIIADFEANKTEEIPFIEFYLEFMAICFANLFTGFDPHAVVLGGGLSNFDLLYSELPKRIPNHLLPNAICPVIKKAKYGDSGGVRGAAFLNINK